jgi:hypothetical protein
MDLYEAEAESDKVLFEALRQFTKEGREKKFGIDKYYCRESNISTVYYEHYGDDDTFYYDTEEELKELCVAFMKEWFVFLIYIDT